MKPSLFLSSIMVFTIYVLTHMIIFQRLKKKLRGKSHESIFPFPLPDFCKVSTMDIFLTAWSSKKYPDKLLALAHIMSIMFFVLIIITYLVINGS